MIAAPTRLDPPSVDGVTRRLRAIDLRGVVIHSDGTVESADALAPFESALLNGKPLRAELARRWPELVRGVGECVEVWPGLTLVVLPLDRHRRIGGRGDPPLSAAVVLGPELLDAEQFRLACDAAGLDHRATVASIDPDRLVPADQRGRVTAAARALTFDAVELDKRSQDVASLSGELAHSYEELSLLYKLSSSMTVSRPPGDFLRDACLELQLVSGMRWSAMVLADDEPRLGALSGRVFTAGQPRVDEATIERVGLSLLHGQHELEQPWMMNEPATQGPPGIAQLGSRVLAVAMRGEGSRLGLLLAGDKLDGSMLTSVDSKLCDSLAATLAIFLRNTILFADTQSMFVGTLRALTSAIDAKDSYTHGHSERVALVASLLSDAAGLDAESRRRVHLSGLVHDVGKIGVPEAVLSKPGKLTDEEFEQIKLHPEIGARILQDIRQMHDLIPGVLYHHERWDGRGYPHGLAGRDIPLFGRVIGLADAFDAMSSTRTYRRSLSRDQVLAEVRRCRNSQFDPELADLFVNLDFTRFDELIAQHQSLHHGTGSTILAEVGGQAA